MAVMNSGCTIGGGGRDDKKLFFHPKKSKPDTKAEKGKRKSATQKRQNGKNFKSHTKHGGYQTQSMGKRL